MTDCALRTFREFDAMPIQLGIAPVFDVVYSKASASVLEALGADGRSDGGDGDGRAQD